MVSDSKKENVTRNPLKSRLDKTRLGWRGTRKLMGRGNW